MAFQAALILAADLLQNEQALYRQVTGRFLIETGSLGRVPVFCNVKAFQPEHVVLSMED